MVEPIILLKVHKTIKINYKKKSKTFKNKKQIINQTNKQKKNHSKYEIP